LILLIKPHPVKETAAFLPLHPSPTGEGKCRYYILPGPLKRARHKKSFAAMQSFLFL
jgi:hypothetical protein